MAEKVSWIPLPITDSSSFLFIRIQQNPKYYADSVHRKKRETWEQSLDQYVEVRLPSDGS